MQLDGLPQISDVETLVSLLEDLNIKTQLNDTVLEVDTTEIKMHHCQIIKLNHCELLII